MNKSAQQSIFKKNIVERTQKLPYFFFLHILNY